MQAGEHLLSRSYHTLLRLVLIGNFLSSNKEEHQTARNQQAEHDEQNDERPIRSRLDGEGIDGTVAALMPSSVKISLMPFTHSSRSPQHCFHSFVTDIFLLAARNVCIQFYAKRRYEPVRRPLCARPFR